MLAAERCAAEASDALDLALGEDAAALEVLKLGDLLLEEVRHSVGHGYWRTQTLQADRLRERSAARARLRPTRRLRRPSVEIEQCVPQKSAASIYTMRINERRLIARRVM